MKAGKLHERVAFDFPTSVPTGDGGMEEGWSTAPDSHECWAHFHWLRGGESVLAGRLEGQQAVIVTVRNSTGSRAIKTGWRMRDLRTGEVYNVRTNAPMQDSRHYRELLCESGVAV